MIDESKFKEMLQAYKSDFNSTHWEDEGYFYDLGKSIFKLSRAIRRQIKDYEKNSAFNIFENGISYKLEIICIKL